MHWSSPWAIRWGVAALAAALLLAVAPAARAASTRFVATAAHGGSDGGGANTCLSSTAPCLTVQHAVSEAATGDTIQIGPGVFTEAVSTSEQLSFVGAGAGTSTFNPSSDTAIDAASTGSPGLTVSANVSATVTGLRIRGGVFNDGGGGEVEPAIWDNASSAGPALTISNSVLLQANPASPDEIDPALLVTSAKTVVQNSTIVGYEDGISVEHTGATLSLQESTVMTPAPASAGLSANIRAAVLVTGASATINDSTLVGLTALYDRAAGANVTRTLMRSSGATVVLADEGSGPTLDIRDSVAVSTGSTFGVHSEALAVAVDSSTMSEPEVPTISLTGDTVFAYSNQVALALDVTDAAIGTHVDTRNTILHALDTSGGSGNDDIATSTQAINWDLGYTDYTQTSGVGVPPPGSGTNVDALPEFNSATDLRLSSSSPLFDKGDPSVVLPGETDILGEPRSEPHTCGAPDRPDLGAYEAAPPPCPIHVVPTPVPTLTNVRQSHKTWRDGGKLATVSRKHHKHKRKAPVGTTFSFALNTASQLTLTFTESQKGRRVHGKCVAQTKRNKHKRSCTRTVPAGAISLGAAPAGTDTIAFQGRVSGSRKLKPGRYSVQIMAANSAGHATSAKLSFTIVKS